MRLAVGMMSVALGLTSLSFSYAQGESPAERASPFNWLSPKKTPAAPPKPSTVPTPTGSGAASTESIQTHVLRQTTCNIPFTVDLSKSAPVELQLYVSQDRGVSWKFYSKAGPSEGKFSFKATADGEYWFALRSVEKVATPVDVKKLIPGLKVIFDTREPSLRFDATLIDSGEIQANWKVSDPTLVPESLKVEYQTDPQTPWRMVMLPSIEPSRDGSCTGTYRWTPEGSADAVVVRAEVSDRAGNKTVISRRLLSRQVAGRKTDEFHPRSQSMATYPVAQEGQSWPVDNQLPPRIQTAQVDPHGELPPPKPLVEGPSAPRRDMVRNPFISTKQLTPTGQSSPGGQLPVEEEIAPATGPLNQNQPAPIPQPQNVSSSTNSLIPHHETPIALPRGERPRMTNAREFSLDYEIDSMGPTGVAKVELWGTSDGGRNWERWQEDTDRKSPIDVSVEQDGIFGFRIVIFGGNQLGGEPPQPGDPADLWVGVDTSAPTVRLTSAIYGEGEHAGQLDIRWQAFDVWFTERPITLQFSEHPQGPWTTIAAGLPNAGQYYWPVEPRIPRRIYLRIEGRDEAGNFAEHQINEAISTAGLIPQGRIRGLRNTATPPAEDRSAGRGPVAR